MNKCKSEKGITLIALIITIIILLILAVVSMSALNGDGGIIQRTQSATEQYKIAQEKEEIGLAINVWQLESSIPGKNVTLKGIIEEELSGEINIPVTENGDGSLTVVFTKTGNSYTVTKNGNITKLEDKNNDDNSDEITDDFEIEVQQTLSESSIGTVKLTIIPTIPENWNKREFTEEEEDLAAQLVGENMRT